jgi:hypothetical protein
MFVLSLKRDKHGVTTKREVYMRDILKKSKSVLATAREGSTIHHQLDGRCCGSVDKNTESTP